MTTREWGNATEKSVVHLLRKKKYELYYSNYQVLVLILTDHETLNDLLTVSKLYSFLNRDNKIVRIHTDRAGKFLTSRNNVLRGRS